MSILAQSASVQLNICQVLGPNGGINNFLRLSAVPEDTERVSEITRYLNARQDTDIGPIAEDNVLKEPMFPRIPLL